MINPSSSSSSTSIVRALAKSLSKPVLARLFLLHRILLLNDGRDKILKVLQYIAKLLVWRNVFKSDASTSGTSSSSSSSSSSSANTKLNALASQFSLTRKCVRLMHCLDPLGAIIDFFTKDNGYSLLLQAITSTKGSSSISTMDRSMKIMGFFNNTITFFQDIIDDLICLAKIGAIDKSWTQKAALSDRCWFTTIHLDMLENYFQSSKMKIKLRQAKEDQRIAKMVAIENASGKSSSSAPIKSHSNPSSSSSPSTPHYTSDTIRVLEDKLFMQKVSMAKLVCDWIYCSYDVFGLDKKGMSSPGWQVISALLAACLGTYKLTKKV